MFRQLAREVAKRPPSPPSDPRAPQPHPLDLFLYHPIQTVYCGSCASPCPTEMVFIVTLWARSAGEGGFRAVRGSYRGGRGDDGSMRMLGSDAQVTLGRKS